LRYTMARLLAEVVPAMEAADRAPGLFDLEGVS
jgi:hypothetical protein